MGKTQVMPWILFQKRSLVFLLKQRKTFLLVYDNRDDIHMDASPQYWRFSDPVYHDALRFITKTLSVPIIVLCTVVSILLPTVYHLQSCLYL